jgi:hypothetical protein
MVLFKPMSAQTAEFIEVESTNATIAPLREGAGPHSVLSTLPRADEGIE